jgi:hypothetical protein
MTDPNNFNYRNKADYDIFKLKEQTALLKQQFG